MRAIARSRARSRVVRTRGAAVARASDTRRDPARGRARTRIARGCDRHHTHARDPTARASLRNPHTDGASRETRRPLWVWSPHARVRDATARRDIARRARAVTSGVRKPSRLRALVLCFVSIRLVVLFVHDMCPHTYDDSRSTGAPRGHYPRRFRMCSQIREYDTPVFIRNILNITRVSMYCDSYCSE